MRAADLVEGFPVGQQREAEADLGEEVLKDQDQEASTVGFTASKPWVPINHTTG